MRASFSMNMPTNKFGHIVSNYKGELLSVFFSKLENVR